MMRFLDKLNTPIALAVMLVLFLILNAFLFYRHQQSMQSIYDASASSEEVALPTSDETQRLRVAVRVEDAPAWLRIREGGTVVFDRSVEPNFYRGEGGTIVFDKNVGPGFYRVFETDEAAVIISTDNAGAVRVESNGQVLGFLGESGQGGAWSVHPTTNE